MFFVPTCSLKFAFLNFCIFHLILKNAYKCLRARRARARAQIISRCAFGRPLDAGRMAQPPAKR